MSKMSQLHAELTQEAYEKGYDSLSDYLLDRALENAHKAWLEEKEQVLTELAMLSDNLPAGGDAQRAVEHAIEFIEKGEI